MEHVFEWHEAENTLRQNAVSAVSEVLELLPDLTIELDMHL